MGAQCLCGNTMNRDTNAVTASSSSAPARGWLLSMSRKAFVMVRSFRSGDRWECRCRQSCGHGPKSLCAVPQARADGCFGLAPTERAVGHMPAACPHECVSHVLFGQCATCDELP